MPVERERRATAGKRLNALVGQALDDDQEFWGHETWKSDDSDGEGAESFHSSDEDSELKRDEFDSDFDETEESEDGDGEVQPDEDEADAAAQKRKKQSAYRDVGSSTAAAAAGGFGGGKKGSKKYFAFNKKAKRIIGDGMNTGIVLNIPFSSATDEDGTPIIPTAPLPPPRLKEAPTAAPEQEEKLPTEQSALSVKGSSTASAAASLEATAPALSSSVVQSIDVATSHNHVHTEQKQVIDQFATESATAPILHTSSSTVPIQQQQPIAVPASPKQQPTQAQRLTNTCAATRPRRQLQTSKYRPRFRAAAVDAAAAITACTIASTAGNHSSHGHSQQQHGGAGGQHTPKGEKRKRKKLFTQEELLLEAVHETEPENLRWLLGRKRAMHDISKQEQQQQRNASAAGSTIVERYSSRRRCLNVVTFMDMDRIPSVLLQHKPHHDEAIGKSKGNQNRDKNTCVITGKTARYRDPKTLLGYHDKDAFKELRRRIQAGEIDTKTGAPLKGKATTATTKGGISKKSSSKRVNNRSMNGKVSNASDQTRFDSVEYIKREKESAHGVDGEKDRSLTEELSKPIPDPSIVGPPETIKSNQPPSSEQQQQPHENETTSPVDKDAVKVTDLKILQPEMRAEIVPSGPVADHGQNSPVTHNVAEQTSLPVESEEVNMSVSATSSRSPELSNDKSDSKQTSGPAVEGKIGATQQSHLQVNGNGDSLGIANSSAAVNDKGATSIGNDQSGFPADNVPAMSSTALADSRRHSARKRKITEKGWQLKFEKDMIAATKLHGDIAQAGVSLKTSLKSSTASSATGSENGDGLSDSLAKQTETAL